MNNEYDSLARITINELYDGHYDLSNITHNDVISAMIKAVEKFTKISESFLYLRNDSDKKKFYKAMFNFIKDKL